MSKLDPVDHVARPALPWRVQPDITECGKDLARLADDRIITPAELLRRISDLGQKRAAYTTCITCWETASRHRSDQPESIRVVLREVEALQWRGTYALGDLSHLSAARREKQLRDRERHQRLVAELEAIAALVSAHRAEFDGYLAGRDEAVSLAEHRATRREPRRQPRMGGTL